MASIEQDDLFNVEGEEEEEEDDIEEEEELDDTQQQQDDDQYRMDIDQQDQSKDENQDEDEEMMDGQFDQDEDDDEDEEDEEGEGEEEEEEDEDDEEDEEEEEEEEEDEDENEEADENSVTDLTSVDNKERDESKLISQDQLPSTLVGEEKSQDDDTLLGAVNEQQQQPPSSASSQPQPQSQSQPQQSQKKEEDKVNDEAVSEPSRTEKETEPQKAPDDAKDKEHEIDDIMEAATNLSFREKVIQRARRATEFDIIPQVAIPYTSQCQSLAFTEGPKWILTGGEDGFIRKYDFIASVQGKAPLTMAQKHNLLSDSLTNGGVICSYWENEQPLSRKQLMKQNPKLKDSDFSTGSVSYEPKINPVYALDAERNGYWCLSGLLSGGISLYTMRYNEGTIHHYFHQGSKENKKRGHTDAVSIIKLNQEQDRFLSGSWDKTIRQWDLNTGKTLVEYAGSSGQISNIAFRPNGLDDVTFSIEAPNEDVEMKNVETSNSANDDIDSLFGDEDDEDSNHNDDNDDEQRKIVESIDKPKINNGASSKPHLNSNIFMSSSIDGTINIWDVRLDQPVIRLGVPDGVPPWCMSSSWSNNGDFIFAGRRNSTIEEISIKMPHTRSNSGHHRDTMVPNVSKTLQFPKISGPVSALSTLPNDNFLLCGSNDNIRLYNLKLYDDLNSEFNSKKQATPFLIIPGHHGGVLSQLYVDETGRFMVCASGYRGWGHGNFTDTVLVYEIDFQ